MFFPWLKSSSGFFFHLKSLISPPRLKKTHNIWPRPSPLTSSQVTSPLLIYFLALSVKCTYFICILGPHTCKPSQQVSSSPGSFSFLSSQQKWTHSCPSLLLFSFMHSTCHHLTFFSIHLMAYLLVPLSPLEFKLHESRDPLSCYRLSI